MPRHGFYGFCFCYSLGRVPLIDTRTGFPRVYKGKYMPLHSEGNRSVALHHCRTGNRKRGRTMSASPDEGSFGGQGHLREIGGIYVGREDHLWGEEIIYGERRSSMGRGDHLW